MGIIVQKYGGSSVSDIKKINIVCEHIIKEYENGKKVIVVVSAQGKMTDQLIKEEMEITKKPDRREHDVLLSVGEQISIAKLCIFLKEKGYDAVSLTGWQVPIITDSNHADAKIKYINKDRILNYLNDNKIVIIAGFQGIDEHANITTLGRGGSDTTAVAIAAILNAERCDIYTDVDGVFSSDPRKIDKVFKINNISYDEMLELSSMGANVLHNRCVEIGKEYNIPISIKSTFIKDSLGTNLYNNNMYLKKRVITGITSEDKVAKVKIIFKNKKSKSLFDVELFNIIKVLNTNNIKFDMISQMTDQNKLKYISFCINNTDYENVISILKVNSRKLGLKKISYTENLSKISIVGIGLFNNSDIIYKLLKILIDNEIKLHMITTSEIKISILVEKNKLVDALNYLHTYLMVKP